MIMFRENEINEVSQSKTVLNTIGELARIFLQTVDLEVDAFRACSELAHLAGADRVYIIQNRWGEDNLEMKLWADWAADNQAYIRDTELFQNLTYETSGLIRWMDQLGQGKTVEGRVEDLPASERALFSKMNVKTLVAVPIHVEWDWWGFLCLDSLHEDSTSMLDYLEIILIFSDMFGSALQRIEVQNELKQSQERFRTVADFTHAWEYWIDPDGRMIYSSPSYTFLTGFFHEPFPESLDFFVDIIHPDDRRRVVRFFYQRKEKQDMGEIEFRIVNKKAEVRWVSHVSRPVFDNIGNYLGQRASSRDITVQKDAERKLKCVNEELTQTIEHLENLNKTVTTINEMGEMLQRCFLDEEVFDVMKKYSQILFPATCGALYVFQEETRKYHAVMEFGNTPVIPVIDVEDCWALRMRNPYVSSRKQSHLTCKHFPPCVNDLHTFLCVPMIFQDQMLGLYTLMIDEDSQADGKQQAITIAERAAATLANIQLVKKLRQQSARDPLTGLFNRRHMVSILNDRVSSGDLNKDRFAVVMIDLDNFKQLNDRYGHQAGDEVLETVGSFLNTRIRASDTACRYGGDEFTLIFPGMGLTDAEKRTQRLFEEMKELEFRRDGHIIYQLEASIGIACYPEHGSTYDQIIQTADQALYLAKEKGKNQIVIAG